MALHRQVLETNWTWRQAGSDDVEWREAQHYPSEIHVELLTAGLIPDPYKGFHEHDVQWVGEVDWIYKCQFQANVADDEHAVLEFEGLDTVCDVFLNDTKILYTDNQFKSHSILLSSSQLLPSNTLLLHFHSAKLLAKAREEQYGRVRAGSTNLGDPSRVYLRKAQYDWRWDWGPELMTVGPYRPITLITYKNMRIVDIYPRAHVLPASPDSPFVASLIVDLTLEGDFDDTSMLTGRIVMRAPKLNNIIRQADILIAVQGVSTVKVGHGVSQAEVKGILEWQFVSGEVDLWWPVGYGAQPLYDVEVQLLHKHGGSQALVLDIQSRRVGFRTVRLVQDALAMPDEHGTGTTFYFEVNGLPIFCGGSNWIPADNFLTTITPARYRAWLTLLRDGNQNMVRLWGGGVYEPSIFYSLCDELGILVWQDFQFACGVYPAHSSFVTSVREEAIDNVRRLRAHPSLALFCGNNEDYQMVLQWGDVPDLPAVKLYEEVLPDVVSALTDPEIPYHRGSPYGGKGWDTADPTVGDIHQWNVWGGKELAYQEYGRLGGRFVSEFGVPALPAMRTIKYWMDAEGVGSGDWHAQSKVMAQHCKAGSFERRFAIVMNENFRVTENLETYVYRTQAMQSEAVGWAYRTWRRKWGGPGREYTGGALVWQLNDCWPVTSWAIADYFLRPKMAYWTIKRALARVAVGVSRTVVQNRTNDRPKQFYEFGAFQSLDAKLDIWGVNSAIIPLAATLEISCFDLGSTWTNVERQGVVLKPNQATELIVDMPCPGPPSTTYRTANSTTTHTVVVSVRLIDDEGTVLARYTDWPQPYRFLDLDGWDPGLNIIVEEDGETVRVEVEKPVKGLMLNLKDMKTEEEEVKWDDNALDVVPGDMQVLHARGLKARGIECVWLGKEKM